MEDWGWPQVDKHEVCPLTVLLLGPSGCTLCAAHFWTKRIMECGWHEPFRSDAVSEIVATDSVHAFAIHCGLSKLL